jgi:hypothetical protein
MYQTDAAFFGIDTEPGLLVDPLNDCARIRHSENRRNATRRDFRSTDSCG